MELNDSGEALNTSGSQSQSSEDMTIELALQPNIIVALPTLLTNMASRESASSTPSDATSSHFSIGTFSSVTPLTSGSFNNWKLRLTTILGAQRLSKYILREVPTPTEEKALDDHETNCMRALAAIHATVDGENFEVIRNCTDPREAFLRLCKHHDDAGGLSTAHLFSDLVTLRLASEGDLKEHLHKFRKIHNDLQSNLSKTPDIKISEPFIAIILINSLPAEFTPLVQSLLTNFESLTLIRLYSLLNIEATRVSSSTRNDTALSVNRSITAKKQAKKKDNTQSQHTNNDLTCSFCHVGHTDNNCKTKQWREFKEFQKLNKKIVKTSIIPEETISAKMTQDNMSMTEDDVHTSYYDAAFSAFNSSLPTILDSGATSHIFGE